MWPIYDFFSTVISLASGECDCVRISEVTLDDMGKIDLESLKKNESPVHNSWNVMQM